MRPSPTARLAAVSAFGWLALLGLHPLAPAICAGAGTPSPDALAWVLAFGVGPPALAAHWLVMTVATMPLLLAEPVAHIQLSSSRRRLGRALTVFVAVYLGVWLLAGVLITPVAVYADLLGRAGVTETAVLVGLALAWSATPWAQHARNLCHRRPRVGVSGWKADRDCLHLGWATAAPCVATCWAWMLLGAAGGHQVWTMALANAAILLERLTPATRAAWRPPPAAGALMVVWRARRSWAARIASLRPLATPRRSSSPAT